MDADQRLGIDVHNYSWKTATNTIYTALDEIDGYSVAGVGLGLNPKLVTADGSSCPENWSEKEDTLCRIKIGNEDDSASKRAAKLGLAMNTVTGSFANPVTVQAIAVATLIGATKDAGVSVQNYCNFDAQQTVDSQ